MSVLRMPFMLALCCTAVLQGALVQAQGASSASQIPTFTRIAAPADKAAVPLYSGPAPGSEGRKEPEVWNLMTGNRVVRNVVQPTITPVLPAPGKATGASVIVVAGGGFQFLSLDVEGWPIARWLADHGIAAFVLKYRLNETPGDEAAFSQKMIATFMTAMSGPDKSLPLKEPLATADVLQAISMVRSNAQKWHVDPARVGVHAEHIAKSVFRPFEGRRFKFLVFLENLVDALGLEPRTR